MESDKIIQIKHNHFSEMLSGQLIWDSGMDGRGRI